MPKAEAIASKVAIVEKLSDLSLPLCTLLKHTGNRKNWLQILQHLTQFSGSQAAIVVINRSWFCYFHTVVFISRIESKFSMSINTK